MREQLRAIVALSDTGRYVEAREASADLLFDFQPLLVAHRDLTSVCEDVLLRCGATALRRRFLLATHGENGGPPGPLASIPGPAGRPRGVLVWPASASPEANASEASQRGRATERTKQEV